MAIPPGLPRRELFPVCYCKRRRPSTGSLVIPECHETTDFTMSSDLTHFSREIRRIILHQSRRANVGHIGCALSIADIISALYGSILRIKSPDDHERDRFVLSKGHAVLAVYAALQLKGWATPQDVDSYCCDNSLFGVHPERALHGVDFSSGSPGREFHLPKGLIHLVDRALSLNPARRPSASELARSLRGAAEPRRRQKSRSASLALPEQAGRAGAAVLAGAFAGWTAAELPFYPHGWAVALALGAAARDRLPAAARARVALAVPVLPLGNVSLGLAVLYAALAAALARALAGASRAARCSSRSVPLLAPLAALGLVPLAAARACAPARAAPRRPRSPCSPPASSRASAARRSRSPARVRRSASASPASTDPLDVAGTLAAGRRRAPGAPRRGRRVRRDRRSRCRTPRLAAAGAQPASARRCWSSDVLAVPVARRRCRSSSQPG